MEKLQWAVALIRNSCNQPLSWLARQDEQTGQLGFVIGQRLENESFRETTTREVAWELGLDRKRDFLVSNMAQMNLEIQDRIPGEFNDSHLQISFYNVEIYRQHVREALQNDSRNFWVKSGEICEGVTQCGRRFDPLVPFLINRSNVIQYWESSSGH